MIQAANVLHMSGASLVNCILIFFFFFFWLYLISFLIPWGKVCAALLFVCVCDGVSRVSYLPGTGRGRALAADAPWLSDAQSLQPFFRCCQAADTFSYSNNKSCKLIFSWCRAVLFLPRLLITWCFETRTSTHAFAHLPERLPAPTTDRAPGSLSAQRNGSCFIFCSLSMGCGWDGACVCASSCMLVRLSVSL